ncbi:MAG TPA: hypothetical protein DCZ55_28730 [Cyanobacteria bacterium UBA11371]|nr:hypothetical protein [Cyanobacteria bacterium UBA11371]
MENHEETLKQLAIQAQQHPVQSSQRRLALNKLVGEIVRSPNRRRRAPASWPAHLYHDLYNQALNKTLLEICQKIDQYNPEYPVMAWVNEILGYRCLDVGREYNQNTLPTYSLNELKQELPDLKPLDDEDEMLAEFLRSDPENRLKIFIKGHPEATLQVLALAILEEGKTWKQLSIDFGIPMQTIVSFVKRNLQNLTDYFRNNL